MQAPAGIELFQLPALPETLPNQIHHYPPSPAYRLGRQFEDVISTALELTGCQLLGRNIPLYEGKRTLGELDFIYQTPHQQIVHLEAAVKFYLFSPTTDSIDPLAAYIGPNGRDRLDKKWQRLINHQLPLLHQPVTTTTLQRAGIALPDQQQLLLTGMLFYPLLSATNLPEPLDIHPQHNRGWWLHQRNLHPALFNTQDRFIVLPRWYWLGALSHQPSPTALTYQQLCRQLKETTPPCMLAVIREENGRWRETGRGIIVQDSWPCTEKAR